VGEVIDLFPSLYPGQHWGQPNLTSHPYSVEAKNVVVYIFTNFTPLTLNPDEQDGLLLFSNSKCLSAFNNTKIMINKYVNKKKVTNSLWIKLTDAHHQEFLAVHRLWYILCCCDDCLLPGVTESLLIKPTDALNSSFIGITTLHVSGSLSAHHQEFLAVHRLWYITCSCGDRMLPGVGWHSMPSYSW
jgi:hypothetical protein